MITLRDCATIQIQATYDEQGRTETCQFKWRGRSDMVGCTYEFLDQGDPRWITIPAEAKQLKAGDVIKIGPYTLMVEENYIGLDSRGIVFARRDRGLGA